MTNKHSNSYRGRRMVTLSSDPEIADALYLDLDWLMANAGIYNERGEPSLSVFLRMLGFAAHPDPAVGSRMETLYLVQQIVEMASESENAYREGVIRKRSLAGASKGKKSSE